MPFAVIKNIILFHMALLFSSQLVIMRNEFQVITFSLNEKRLKQSCRFERRHIQVIASSVQGLRSI